MKESIQVLGPATFLINVRNEIEANIVESILNGQGIPTLRKQKEVGSYLNITMGMSIYGIDIYVPESLVERSRDLLDTEMKITARHNQGEEVAYMAQLDENRRKKGMFLIGLLWGFPLIIWLVVKVLS